MIRKSLVTVLIVLLGYHVFFPHISQRFFQIPGQQRNNFVREQDYLCDSRSDANVIAGTSLANTLNDHIFGPNYLKLTFTGNSVLTALEIIDRSGKKPKVILVETNVWWQDADTELLNDALNPGFRALRNASDIFTERGRPINFIAGILEACVRRSCQLTTDLKSRFNKDQSPKPSRPFGHVENAQFALTPKADLLEQRATKLGALVDKLRRSGSHCVLFTMPVDNELASLSGPRSWDRKLHERFPESQYDWVTFDLSHQYATSDGLHLMPAEADYVSRSIVHQLEVLHASSSPAVTMAAVPVPEQPHD